MKNNLYTKSSTSMFSRWMLITSCILLSLFSVNTYALIPVTITTALGTETPVIGGAYPSFAAALAAVNGLTALPAGDNITLTMGGGSETAPATGFLLQTALTNAAATLTINTALGFPSTLVGGTGTGTPGSAVQDGILTNIGTDYVTIDGTNGITFSDPNTTNPATMEYGIGLFKSSATNGCQFNTIQNCTISLSINNNAAGTAPAQDGSRGIFVTNSLATTQTTQITPTVASGTNSNNRFYGNNISNCNIGIGLSGFAATTGVGPAPTPGTFLGDLNNDIGGSSSVTGNTVTNFGGAAAAANPAAGIRANNQWSLNISYNTVNNNTGAGTNHVITLRGIYAQAGTSANVTISNNTVTVKSAALSSACTAIENVIGSTALGNTVTVTNNTVTGCTYTTATSGTFTGILQSGTAATQNVTGNTVTGTVMGTSGSANSCTFQGIYNSASSGTNPVNMNNNTVTFNVINNQGGTMYCTRATTANITFNGNTVNNNGFPLNGGTLSASLYGYYNFGSPTIETYNNNNIDNLYISGSSSSVSSIIRGIYKSTSSSSVTNINGNNINTLTFSNTSTGAGVIYGIYQDLGTTVTISKNKICDITANGASSQVNGIGILSGTTVTVSNNRIGRLFTPTANAANPLIGLSITGGTTVNAYYNTVYLNAPTGGALFGSSALSASVTPTVTLNNNIFVNTSVNNGAGLTVAYRRSSTSIGTYGATSDRNDFFAPVIYTDGTAPFTFTVFGPGAGSYQAYVAARDANSISENPPFLSTLCGDPNFLKISTAIPTGVESGGANIAGITDDFEATIRFGNPGYIVCVPTAGTAPDIGADEFCGTPLPQCAAGFTPGAITGATAVCTGLGTTLTSATATPIASGYTYQWAASTVSGGPYTNSGTALSQATGALTVTTYYVMTVTCAFGGVPTNSTEFTVTVNSLPNVTVAPTSGSYCFPQTGVTLTANNAVTYSWAPSSGLSAVTGNPVTATPSANTIYTVTGTDGNGCVNTASSSITSGTAPLNLTATANPASICNGSTTTVTATSCIPSATGVNNYLFSAGTGAALADMTGSTQLLGSGLDVTASSVANIGFNFTFGLVSQSQFSVSCNGVMGLGATAVTGADGNGSTTVPTIIPAWDDMHTGSDGNVIYKLFNSFPNRILVVEWNYKNFGEGTGTPVTKKVQVWLYEGTNQIKFIYGPNTGAALGSATVGVVSAAGVFNDVNTSTNVNNTVTAQDANTVWPPTGTVYSFTPPCTGLETYSWQPNAFVLSPTASSTGTTALTVTTVFTVTATNGTCSSTATKSVTVGANLICDPITISGTPCEGVQTVTANVNAGAAGSPPYTYAWTANGVALSSTTATINAAAGTDIGYQVQITDLCSQVCISTVLSVTTNSAPTVTASPSTGLICKPSGSPVSISETGGAATTWAWSPASSLDNSTGSTVSANPTATTTYTVLGTDANGCTSTSTSTVTVSNTPNISSISPNAAVCSGASVPLEILVSYSGSFSSTGLIDVPAGQPTVTSGPAGPYPSVISVTGVPAAATLQSVKINNINHTWPSDIRILLQSPSGTNVTLADGVWNGTDAVNNNITLQDGAPDMTTGNISDGTFAPTALSTSTWPAPGPFTVSNPPALSQFTGSSNGNWNLYIFDAVGGDPGSIGSWQLNFALTADPTVSYAWEPSASVVTPSATSTSSTALTATTTFTVTATNGLCSNSATTTVTVGATLVCDPLTVSATLCAGTTFTATESTIGGGTTKTYSWSVYSMPSNTLYSGPTVGSATEPFTLPAGDFRIECTVTDDCTPQGSCTESINITVNALPDVQVSPTSGLICNPGGSAITLTASNATSYEWQPASGLDVTTGSVVSANPLVTTTYVVKGTDGNGCSNTASSTISLGNAVTMSSVTASNPSVACGGTSVLTANASNYTAPPYCIPTVFDAGQSADYLDNFTFANITNNASGDALTDYTYYSALTANVVADGTTLYNISLQPGSPTWSEQFRIWIDFDQSGTFDATESVFATSVGNNSSVTVTATTTIPTSAYNGITRMRVECKFSSVTTALEACANPGFGEYEDYNVSITGGVNPPPSGLSYTWTPSNELSASTGNPVTATPTATTTWTVVATGGDGCSASGTVSVTFGATLVCGTLSTSSPVCAGTQFTVSSTSPTGGGSPYSYSWSDGTTNVYSSTTSSVTASLPAGTYIWTATVTDNCGSSCFSTLSVEVNPSPSVSIAPTSGQICNPGGTPVDLNASSATATSYVWSPTGDVTQSISVNPNASTTYTVVGTDVLGCTGAATVFVQVGETPSLTASAADPNVCDGVNTNLAASGSVSFGGYCASSHTAGSCGFDEWISQLTLGTINNTIGTCPLPALTVADYTAQSTTLSPAGSPYSLTATITDPFSSDQLHAWIDFDHSNTFDAGEEFTGVFASPVFTVPITVPGTAYNGVTRMRVVLSFATTPLACGTMTYGVTQDYTVDISGATPAPATAGITYSWSPAANVNNSTTSTPQTKDLPSGSTTVFTVTACYNGCCSTATTSVTSGEALSCTDPTVSSGAICAGTTFTVTSHHTGGGGPYTVTWVDDANNNYSGESIYPNLSAGSYTFTSTVLDNCGSTCSAQLLVVVNPLPDASIDYTTLCSNDLPITLTAVENAGVSGTLSYQWKLNGTNITAATLSTYTATTAGSYTVVITANGCSDESAAIDICVSPAAPLITSTATTITCGGSSTITVQSAYNQTFNNGGAITINDFSTASPYPDVISVSGVPIGASLVSVQINGISHTFPGDIDMLLQSPTSTNVTLMSDQGGGTDLVNNNLVISDAGVPFPSIIVDGTYHPTNDAGTDDYAAPGPGLAFSDPTPALATFGTGNHNGNWNLLVVDDAGTDVGSITSWSLTFQYDVDPCVSYTWSPSAGLNTTMGSSVSATPASTTVYTVVATNCCGCTSSSTTTVNVSGSCGVPLYLKVFIEGYYEAAGTSPDFFAVSQMRPCLYLNEGAGTIPALPFPQGPYATTDCDYIEISAMSDLDGTLLESQTGLLQVDGTVNVSFTTISPSNMYYIRLVHRNALETWSSVALDFSTTSAGSPYDFTTAKTQAYSTDYGLFGMHQMSDGPWAILSGDMGTNPYPTGLGIQDGNIDSYDFNYWDADNSAFNFGYLVGDLNGDVNVDSYDYNYWDVNNANFEYVQRPF